MDSKRKFVIKYIYKFKKKLGWCLKYSDWTKNFKKGTNPADEIPLTNNFPPVINIPG